MPIPIAHPMAVLPIFRYSHILSVSALIIGSMVPDFEHFLELRVSDKTGHTILGVFIYDLPVGIIIYYINKWYLKPILKIVSPIRFRQFYHPVKRYTFLQIVLSLLIGIATHFLLDAVTGEEGYFVKDLPYLFTEVQVTSSVRMNIHLIIWIFVSIFGAMNCFWMMFIAFDYKKTVARFRLHYWSIQYFVEVFLLTVVICILRYFLMGNPYILWNWGIVIGGATFFSFTLISMRWKFAQKGYFGLPKFLSNYKGVALYTQENKKGSSPELP
ncbi:DUF4184 family protein [Flammeovirga sp. MY04]|uniref:DUF4184 family protein n=1 Tax=Flammeovirga sp. MY04 TaxID=1191459 RepID=UPI00080623A9|nr:DUF4184 family protein [Flammeovirga sp. MY04]ANQ48378.1 DUF4184 family protein [Flammeovirga sp. MY04]